MQYPLRLIVILLFLSLSAQAQDKIYLRRNKIAIKAKVVAIDSTHISYVRLGDPDEDVRRLSKREVSHILYENGYEEKFGIRTGPGVYRKAVKDEYLKLQELSNIISVKPGIFNTEGVGLGLAYEHLLGKKRSVGLNVLANYYPFRIRLPDNQENIILWRFSPSIRFYPGGNIKRVRSSLGAGLSFFTGYKLESYYPDKKLNMRKVAAHLSYSIGIATTRHINMSFALGGGYFIYRDVDQPEHNDSQYDYRPGFVELNFSVGYRFR